MLSYNNAIEHRVNSLEERGAMRNVNLDFRLYRSSLRMSRGETVYALWVYILWVFNSFDVKLQCFLI